MRSVPYKEPEARARWEAAHPERKADRHRRDVRSRFAAARGRRAFVAVDGEGAYAEGDPDQRYVLLSDSLKRTLWRDEGLSTRECLDFLLAIPRKLDAARVVPVGFGLDYDVNFWLADLPPDKWERLFGPWHDCLWDGALTGHYRLRYIKGKWFEAWHFACLCGYKHKTAECGKADAYVRVDDVRSLFNGKFVRVVEEFLGKEAVSALLSQGKERRVRFSLADREEMTRYNAEENRLLVRVMEHFDASLESIGIRPPHYCSPAILGKLDLTLHRAKEFIPHGKEQPAELPAIFECAFFGGRIESADVGRAWAPIEEWDRNASYPATESTLPNLVGGGRWVRGISEGAPLRVALYLVRWDFRNVPRRYYPFPFRTEHGSVKFPPSGTAWLWGPEVRAGVLYGGFPEGTIRILDGWEFKEGWEPEETEVGSAWRDRIVTNCWRWSDDFATWPADPIQVINYSPNPRPVPNDRPFAWVEDRYLQRLELKAKKDPAEYSVKIQQNSHYGAFAQQLFLDPTKPSPFAHLGLAGFITASTRAALYRVARRIGEERVIAFATDGLFVRSNGEAPENSTRLGGWKVKTHRDGEFVQAGVRRTLHREGCDCGKCGPDGWEVFGRGFGGVDVPFEAIERAWSEHREKVAYEGRARFVGHRQAAARHQPKTWRNWVPEKRSINLASAGKKRNPLPRAELIDPSRGLVGTYPISTATNPESVSLPYRFRRDRALAEIDADAEPELEDEPSRGGPAR